MADTTKRRPRVALLDSPLDTKREPTRLAATVVAPTPAAPAPSEPGETIASDAGPASIGEPPVRALAAPALDERERRLAVDIPESLVDAFSSTVEQLRRDGDRRASQKALSNREVMAALLWDALGDPTDPAAVARVRARLLRYRASQLEQAAAAARADS